MATTTRRRPDNPETLARLYCGRCDSDGLTWRRDDGTPTTRDDPHAVTAARCRHPKLYRRTPAHVLDDELDE